MKAQPALNCHHPAAHGMARPMGIVAKLMLDAFPAGRQQGLTGYPAVGAPAPATTGGATTGAWRDEE